jgi:hypothetical protein
VDERLSCVTVQLKSHPVGGGHMLHKDYQLAAGEGYLVRFCLKMKRYRDEAHH